MQRDCPSLFRRQWSCEVLRDKESVLMMMMMLMMVEEEDQCNLLVSDFAEGSEKRTA